MLQNVHEEYTLPPPPFLAEQNPCESKSSNRCCFRNFWKLVIWRFHFLVVHEDHIFSVFLGLVWYFRDIGCYPYTHFHPSLSFRGGDWGIIDDAIVTSCVFSRFAHTTSL